MNNTEIQQLLRSKLSKMRDEGVLKYGNLHKRLYYMEPNEPFHKNAIKLVQEQIRLRGITGLDAQEIIDFQI